jgi:hypothetical protein
MSQQIQITGGAKVRNLQDVIIGTSGVLSSVAFDVANGVPRLDVNGKILVSQLPNSVMEYKGVWNAASNSPTLTNGGAFNEGDVYLCNVAGTVNFGAGPISFIVGDQAIYSGSVWQKAGGATGTVTSVGLSTNAGAITIGNSPISTSGTITANFNGTNLQYVNGAGNLTTFPILTGFVPYTGATASVDLGAFLLTASGVDSVGYTARGSGTLSGYLILKQGTTFLGNVVGYNSINANSTKYTFISDVDGTNYKSASFELGSLTNNTARTYTLPNANGTIALTSDIPILTGYVPYTGATQDVDLGAFKLNAQSLHIKGTAGNGHLGLKHQSASATASANEVSLFADSLGDLGWLNGNLYLSKFIISGNTAARSYTFPNANGTVALTSDLSNYVDLTTAQTIGGTKTFSDATKNNGGIFLQNASSNSLAGYMNLGGLTNGVKFTSGGGISNTFTLPSATGYTFTFPNATGTLALTSDIPANPIGGTGTSGQVAYFNGTSSLTSSSTFAFTPTSQLLVNNSVTAASAIARGTNLTPTLTAAANSDILVGLDINPTFTNGAFTGVSNFGLRVQNTTTGNNIPAVFVTTIANNANTTAIRIVNTASSVSSIINLVSGNVDNQNPYFAIQNRNNAGTINENFRIFQSGNVTIQNGGTFTDAGYKLDVNGTARVSDLVHLNNASGGQIRMWTSTANNSGIYGINSSSTGIYGNAHVQFDLFIRSTGSGIKKFGQSSLGNTNNICITNNNTSLEPIMITTTDSGAVGIMKSTSTIPASAVFEIESTTKGFLPPRMTTTQRTAISSPATGLIVYQTDSVEGLYVYSGGSWKSLTMV